MQRKCIVKIARFLDSFLLLLTNLQQRGKVGSYILEEYEPYCNHEENEEKKFNHFFFPIYKLSELGEGDNQVLLKV